LVDTVSTLKTLGCQNDKHGDCFPRSDSTFFLVINQLDPAHFESIVGTWPLEQHLSVMERLALDGKVMRDTGRGDGNPINAFTMGAIASDAGVTPEEFRRLL
jgi:hypothetical protein